MATGGAALAHDSEVAGAEAVRATAVLRLPRLARNDEEGSANMLREFWPRDRGQRGENGGGRAPGGLGQLRRGIAATERGSGVL